MQNIDYIHRTILGRILICKSRPEITLKYFLEFFLRNGYVKGLRSSCLGHGLEIAALLGAQSTTILEFAALLGAQSTTTLEFAAPLGAQSTTYSKSLDSSALHKNIFGE